MSNPLNLHPAEYDALCSAMAPLLEVAGWTELSKTYPFVRVYRKTLSRVKFLDNLLSELDDLRYKLSWSWIYKRSISYLRREREYAEAVFSRLDRCRQPTCRFAQGWLTEVNRLFVRCSSFVLFFE